MIAPSGGPRYRSQFCFSIWGTPAGTLSSMITKTNNTMIAPAYTITCIAAMNWACSMTYKADSDTSVPINERALYSGLRCMMTFTALVTAIIANTMNTAFSIPYLKPGNNIMTVAVKITFRMAAGNRNFQPKVMS